MPPLQRRQSSSNPAYDATAAEFIWRDGHAIVALELAISPSHKIANLPIVGLESISAARVFAYRECRI
jgi:hypothetical protein